jgi:hypothetical protein
MPIGLPLPTAELQLFLDDGHILECSSAATGACATDDLADDSASARREEISWPNSEPPGDSAPPRTGAFPRGHANEHRAVRRSHRGGWWGKLG